jgi:hypothetical protein
MLLLSRLFRTQNKCMLCSLGAHFFALANSTLSADVTSSYFIDDNKKGNAPFLSSASIKWLTHACGSNSKLGDTLSNWNYHLLASKLVRVRE